MDDPFQVSTLVSWSLHHRFIFFFFNLPFDLLTISNMDPLWWQIKHKWASRSEQHCYTRLAATSVMKSPTSSPVEFGVSGCIAIGEDGWAGEIRVGQRGGQTLITLLCRERETHTEGEGERWEIKQFLTFPQRKFMLHYYLIIYMNPNKRSGLGQHFDSFVKVIHFQRALQGTLVHLDGLLLLHVLNIPSAKLHN